MAAGCYRVERGFRQSVVWSCGAGLSGHTAPSSFILLATCAPLHPLQIPSHPAHPGGGAFTDCCACQLDGARWDGGMLDTARDVGCRTEPQCSSVQCALDHPHPLMTAATSTYSCMQLERLIDAGAASSTKRARSRWKATFSERNAAARSMPLNGPLGTTPAARRTSPAAGAAVGAAAAGAPP